MTDSQNVQIDEIDSYILSILARDPRTPYKEIADELDDAGFEMSGEGIRYRVRKLMDVTTTFFFIDLEQVTGEIVRIAVTVSDDPDAKQRAYEAISEMPFWHTTRGIGTYDVYAVGIAKTIHDIDELVTTVKELECVDSVEHIVATERNGDIEDYLSGFRGEAGTREAGAKSSDPGDRSTNAPTE